MLPQESDKLIIALLSGPDQPGLVAKVSGWVFERGGNILHADQHRDGAANVFFQRVEWLVADGVDPELERQAFRDFSETELGMRCEAALGTEAPRVGIMVSKIDHCFHDIALRFRAGELPGRAVCVVSNHPDLGEASASYGLPFHYVPVTKANKADAEREQIRILREAGVDLVIMARYMQVLSADFLANIGSPVINIHHSFLPAFAGGRPYHQAYERGVKLIGATAHYATVDLDEGPIIAQDVARVTHRHGPADLVRRGKDLEKQVFAQAIRWHLEHRILVYHNKTVVFD
ncbi:MAG: formyltetrahydrofolate deformylase [Puniceicoccales bacterium]